jgi:hypothetical protein
MAGLYGAAKTARRLAPIAAEAYRRWNALSPEEKERYKARARSYAQRGQDIVREAIRLMEQQRANRLGGGGKRGGRKR